MSACLHYDELRSHPCNVQLELYRLRAHEQVCEFKAELRRDRAIVEQALDNAFAEIDLLENRSLS